MLRRRAALPGGRREWTEILLPNRRDGSNTTGELAEGGETITTFHAPGHNIARFYRYHVTKPTTLQVIAVAKQQSRPPACCPTAA